MELIRMERASVRQLVKIIMKMIRTVTLTWIMVSERNLLVRKDEIN